ncbi:MAG: DUF6680 family protein [Nitrospirales bacterium]
MDPLDVGATPSLLDSILPCTSVETIVTIMAILLGPMFGVWLTHRLQDYKDQRQKRMDIFRALMRTRGLPRSVEQVGALNLILVEFAKGKKDKKVRDACDAYIQELVIPYSTDNEANREAKRTKENTLLSVLIREIGKTLNFELDGFDILQKKYVPQDWLDDETRKSDLLIKLINLFRGRNSVPVTMVKDMEPPKVYPDPPKKHEE